jgi:3-oxoacyl-[acyl-carrier-protein] synthase II
MNPIYIQGIGAVCSLGKSWPEIWKSLLAGNRSHCTAATVQGLVAGTSSVASVDDVRRNLDGGQLVEGAASRLAGMAMNEAVRLAGCKDSLAVFGGTTYGESDVLLEVARNAADGRLAEVPESHWRSLIEDSLAFHCFRHRNFFEGAWAYSACTSSMHALLLAMLEVGNDDGSLDDAIVVGVDALSVLGTIGFDRIGASSKSGCRPFHIARDGTLVGEGAAAMVISKRQEASSVLGRLLGMGMSCEAGHPTRPSEDGEGFQLAMLSALNRSEVAKSDIAGIILHGTGTQQNDAAEAKALLGVFGQNLPPATSIKGSLGHTMGAAGILNCLTALQACQERVLPPTWSDGSSTISNIDLVTMEPRRLSTTGAIMVNCSGFGGNNVVAIFDK